VLCKCPTLMSVHLSFDTSIQNDDQFKQDLLDIFGGEQEPALSVKGRREYKEFRRAIAAAVASSKESRQNKVIGAKNELIFDLRNKKICQSIAENHAVVNKGIGRQDDDMLGNSPFILTRQLDNFSELQFSPIQGQYFRADKATSWQLSPKSECLICQKHRYVTVFFDRHNPQMNRNLIQIKDPDTIAKIRPLMDLIEGEESK
jgi:hypothetical protein